MQIRELMTQDVTTVNPQTTVQQAARIMADLDIGALPVVENDRIVGVVTDRDIALRSVARGNAPSTKVRDIMTPRVKYCFADQDVIEVVANMADIQVRRLPVVDRKKRLVGILSLGDIATSDEPKRATEALCGISRPNMPQQPNA